MPFKALAPARLDAVAIARLLACLFALGTAIPAAATGQAGVCTHPPVEGRPSIGLALGGGGARGGAHIGVLKALEELRVPVDAIAGTSMGSIVGGFSAVGMTPDEIETLVLDLNWVTLLDDESDRKDLSFRRKTDDDLALFLPKVGLGEGSSFITSGAIAGQKISYVMQRATSERFRPRNFDSLPIPFRAVATDIVSGDEVVIRDGTLSRAMRASMSVPGAFDPVDDGDALLVDGGIVNNLPADVARDLGADIVIAVDVGFPMLPKDELTNALAVIAQLSTLAIQVNTRQTVDKLGERDVLIRPALGDIVGSADFDRIADAIPIGYAAAMLERERLERLAVSEADYRAWRARIAECTSPPDVIRWVRVENETRFSDAVIEAQVDIPVGEPLDSSDVVDSLKRIYALGFIRLASHEIVERDGETGVLIRVEGDPRGHLYLESGVDVSMGSQGSALTLRAALLKIDLDDRGSELRGGGAVGEQPGVFLEAYKYIGDGRRWFVAPRASFEQRDLLFYDGGGQPLFEYEIQEWAGGVSFGREIGRHAAVGLTLRRYGGTGEVKVGPPQAGTDRYDGGEWIATATYDRLDNRYIPSEGSYASLDFVQSRESLGAEAEFEQLQFSSVGAWTFDRHVLLGGLRYNTTLGNDASPIYSYFQGGGFLNLSGFSPGELIGPHYGLALASYRFRLSESGLLPAWAGVSLEYGNAGNERSDIFGDGILNASAYLAYDSPLGPIYLGYGKAEESSGQIFLKLGQVFGRETLAR